MIPSELGTAPHVGDLRSEKDLRALYLLAGARPEAREERVAALRAEGHEEEAKKLHDAPALREAAEKFSSMLYGLMFKTMDASVEKTGLLDGGEMEETFKGFLLENYAGQAATQDGASNPLTLGVFEMLYERHQGGTPVPSMGSFDGLG